MKAEHVLLFLDELDELQIYLREAGQPGFLAAGAVLLLGIAVALWTHSVVLGVVALTLVAWLGLFAAFAVQQLERQRVLAPQHSVAKRRR